MHEGRRIALDARPERIELDTAHTSVIVGDMGFHQTSLHDELQRFGCRHLIVTGCTRNICGESTVRDAMFRDYLPVLLSDCMNEPIGADLPRSNHTA